MRKLRSEKQRTGGTAVGAPFMVVRNLYLGATADRFAPPLKIRDLVIGRVRDRGLENRCNAYVLSAVAKNNVYHRDPMRDVLGVAGDGSGPGASNIPDKQEAYVFTPYEVWETYAVQLYRIEN